MKPQVRLTKRSPNATPLPYTASPLKLLERDLRLFIRYVWAVPLLFFPLGLGQTSSLDELHPSVQGAISLLLQVILTIYQLVFLASLPFLVLFMLPGLWVMVYIAAALAINYIICTFALNGFQRVVVSQAPVPEQPGRDRERWFFINGVAGSHYWMQNNVDLLSYTFGRKITGIHNHTQVLLPRPWQVTTDNHASCGLLFDLLECLIQRCFSYATTDVREAYVLIKAALLDPECEKVVLILHSQGGIEGGLIVDWLLEELPQDLLHNLEVYTFGNAANHFNNPRHKRSAGAELSQAPHGHDSADRSVGYIEHYVNTGDAIAWLGVLHFVGFPNRYIGRLFVRPGSGHMVNQHYLDNMFTLGPDGKVLDSNPFMDMEVELGSDIPQNGTTDTRASWNGHCEETLLPVPGLERQMPNGHSENEVLRVKDFSRLWRYRNGGSPERYKND